ncbi:MAG: HDOD domain-containing protein [Myxococcota bacterium]
MSDTAVKPARVLVVDDDALARDTLRKQIQRLDLEVTTAADGREGLARASELDPAVVVLDLRMPGIDGHTFLRRLASQGSQAAVIVASGDGQMDDVIEVMREGAVAYLKKPWSQGELAAAVLRALDVHGDRLALAGRARAGRVVSRTAVGGIAPPATTTAEPSATAPSALPPAAATPAAAEPALDQPIGVAGAPAASEPPPTGRLRRPGPPAIAPADFPGKAPRYGARPRSGMTGHNPRVRADHIFGDILKRIDSGEITVPATPGILSELRLLVADVDTPIERIAGLVERDQAVLARVLRLGRSPTYAGRDRNDDLRAIIGRVGFKPIHELVESIWLRACFQVKHPDYVPLTTRIARHAVARAFAMRAIAEQRGLDSTLAYLGGLFADAGASFLLWVLAERSGLAAPEPERALQFVVSAHEDTGARLLGAWGLPKETIDLARGHHGLVFAGEPMGQAFALANLVASDLAGDVDLTEAQTASQRRSNIDPAVREELVERLRARYATMLDLIG